MRSSEFSRSAAVGGGAARVLLQILVLGALADRAGAQGYRVVCPDAGILPNELTQSLDGTFYGTTAGGGDFFAGTVFKMDAACNRTVLHHFSGAPGDGKNPRAGLLVAADGFLYGTTYNGGGNDFGTVFRLDTDGNNYSFVSQLSPGGACGLVGNSPYGPPVEAKGAIYVPMTICGPLGGNGSSEGTIVSVTSALAEAALGYFDPQGAILQPFYRLVEGSDSALYGMARASWFMTDKHGAIFKMPLGGGDPQLVHAFSGPEGADPDGPPSFSSDGSLWGTTQTVLDPGTTGPGTVYRMPSGGSLSAVHFFTEAEGPVWEHGGVTQGPDNFLYGMTRGLNGSGLDGVIFRLDLAGNYAAIAKVGDAEIGRVPYWGLYKGLDGKLYGECAFQATGSSVGTYFSIDTSQRIDSITPTSGPAAGGTGVSIAGDGFVAGAQVELGGVAATGEGVPDPQHVDAVTPGTLAPGSLSLVKVRHPDTTVILLANGWFADFLDVPQSDIFHSYVEAAVRNGITAGCGGGNYCRNSPVTRAQMAVFLEKAVRGATFVPPACAGAFPDVPCGSPFAPWIEQLAADGITGGCGGGNYCPDNPVLRQQMAVFLLKAEHGSSYDPPDCAGVFDDVTCTPGAGFSDWIEQLVIEAITGGCSLSPPLYCPLSAVTRGQMAVFLQKTFGS